MCIYHSNLAHLNELMEGLVLLPVSLQTLHCTPVHLNIVLVDL